MGKQGVCGFHGTESDGLGGVIYAHRNFTFKNDSNSDMCVFDEREVANSTTLIL